MSKPKGPQRKQRGGSIDKAWEDATRQKIQASQIINRLVNFVNGEVSLLPHQVTAAVALLRKVLPDLASVEVSGELTVPTVMRIPSVADTTQAWQQQHTPAPNKTLQ